ncbi:MAG: C40 family peptidase [Bacilli bacterium]|nr:C40 family peptidase [Bacilli bacterium]
MEKEKSVSPTLGNKKVKRMNLYSNVFFVLAMFSLVGYQYYDKIHREQIYDALSMTFKEVAAIEYGSDDYDTVGYVESVEYGRVVDYPKTVDTSTVGVKKLTYELGKEEIKKEFVLEVEVKDTKLPVIKLNKNVIYIYAGYKYDVKSNVKSVTDEVDGALKYVTKAPKEQVGYYTISTNYNKDKVGSYNVTIKATDKNGNVSKANYTIKVISRPQPKVTYARGNYTGPSSVDRSSVVNAAKSLIGSRYRYGGASPSTGFDCSGFVSYVYSLFGKHLSRNATGLSYNGRAVSRKNMQPGDIIVWSTLRSNSPTHVAIYVGSDTMVHAANTRLGVISSSVSYWESHGGGHIVTIRRV